MDEKYHIHADGCYVFTIHVSCGRVKFPIHAVNTDDLEYNHDAILSAANAINVRSGYIAKLSESLVFVKHLSVIDEKDFQQSIPPVMGALSIMCHNGVRTWDNGTTTIWRSWKIVQKLSDTWHDHTGRLYYNLENAKGAMREIIKLRTLGNN